MRRGGMFAALVAVIVAVWVATNGRHRAPERPAAAPDTAVAGTYASAEGPDWDAALRLTGSMTARLETRWRDGRGPDVDTGAWTKDDSGRVVVTLAPRDTATGSGDTLRFEARGDTLWFRSGARGYPGFRLARRG